MKAIKNIFFLGLATASLLVSCTEKAPEREPAAPETNAIQAYIAAETSDVVIRPNGTQWLISWGGGEFVAATPKFPVVIGRRDTKDAATLPLTITDEDGVFTFEESINFKAGQAIDTLWVGSALEIGEVAVISIAIGDAKYTTVYGPSAFDIEVAVDYTWIAAGSVLFSSGFEGVNDVKVMIEKAQEYNTDGNYLYRLISPYYYAAPDYCTEPGYHLPFIVDANYKAVDLNAPNGYVQVENTNFPYIVWDPVTYAEYESFTSQGNTFVLNALFGPNPVTPYYTGTESWVWDNGFPGAE